MFPGQNLDLIVLLRTSEFFPMAERYLFLSVYACLHVYRVGKNSFAVIPMENNIIINKNSTRINSVFCILTTINLLLPTPIYCKCEKFNSGIMKINLKASAYKDWVF